MKRFLTALAFAILGSAADAAQITVSGQICDPNGCAPFSVTVQTDQVTLTSATVVPAIAAPNTMRTLTVVGASSAGLTLTCTVNPVTGITFTPVTGQPNGTCVWTFVY